MRHFYQEFYRQVPHSAAHAEFCERVFGRDLAQHGFTDVAQLDRLIAELALQPGDRALDVGCGTGLIAEYLADRTGAHVTGIDYVPLAIDVANQRVGARRATTQTDRLEFLVGDINALDLPAGRFDAIVSIDSIYFSDDYARTIGQLRRALRPGGRMGIYFGHGRAGWVGPDPFDPATLEPDRTPLADALVANGLRYAVTDVTAEDYRLACSRLEILPTLHARFLAESIGFVYENRIAESAGIRESVQEGMHRRYLYRVQLDAETEG